MERAPRKNYHSIDKGGFLKTARSKMEHPIFLMGADRWGAFQMMLMFANYHNRTEYHNGQLVKVPRGSFIMSERDLAKHFGWSRPKVQRFLGFLEECGEISLKKLGQGLGQVITLINYEEWQGNWAGDQLSGNQDDHEEFLYGEKETKEDHWLGDTPVDVAMEGQTGKISGLCPESDQKPIHHRSSLSAEDHEETQGSIEGDRSSSDPVPPLSPHKHSCPQTSKKERIQEHTNTQASSITKEGEIFTDYEDVLNFCKKCEFYYDRFGPGCDIYQGGIGVELKSIFNWNRHCPLDKWLTKEAA